MHYRRMEPQPAKRIDAFLGVSRAVYCAIERPTGGAPRWADGERTCVDVPKDMPGATPWRDRQGEWYWRKGVQS